MEQGYVLLHRSICDCWVWQNSPFGEGQAWVDLVLLANHEDKKIRFNGQFITVKRGQRITSMRSLATRWKWGKDKVVRFLNALEQDKMIDTERDSKKTLITIVNYDKYQFPNTHNETQTRQYRDSIETVSRQYRDKTNNDKELKKNENKDFSSLRSDKFAQSDDKVIVELPTNKTDEIVSVHKSYVDEMSDCFRGVDVENELRKMRAWLLNNQQKRKTARGMKKFINSWLERSQNNGGYNRQVQNQDEAFLRG